MTKIIKMKPLAQACTLILAASSLVSMSNAIAASAPGGTSISNMVTATYQDANGKEFTSESNVIEMTVREVRSATLTAGKGAKQEVLTNVTKITSIHVLENTGNVEETYKLVATNAEDDSVDATKMSIYLDTDDNGDLSAEEIKAPIEEITLAMGTSVSLIIVTELPKTTAGDTLHITLAATDSKGTAVEKTNDVKVTFQNIKDNIKDAVIMPNGKGSSCNAYAWIKQGETWNNANTKASNWIYKGQKGHLATLTTAEENAFVAGKFNAKGGTWWIGAQRTINGTAFTNKWVTGEDFTYKNFNKGEPNDNAEKGLNLYDNGTWNDLLATASLHYIVEFELGACPDAPKPEIVVKLTAAKDTNCDGKAEAKFGDVKLEDMASNECVIMHMRAENTTNVAGYKLNLKHPIPDSASYIPNSITVCGWTDSCKLTKRSDSVDNKTGKGDFAYYDADSGTVVIGGYSGKTTSNMKAKGIVHAEYRLKID